MTTRVVYGTKEAVASALAKVGHKINTAFIERLNRTLRAHVPGLGRREEGATRSSETVVINNGGGRARVRRSRAATAFGRQNLDNCVFIWVR